ncbi:hypothetical protein BC830DRAFT_1234037 [Chytriomyces sp. MP71]|nr:hypothetical protein BC830DRAFT_1234037 [Chytriomyces sp. MP71]
MATLSAQNETLSAALEALRSPIASDRIDALEQENARLRAELQSHPSCGEQDAFTLDARIAVLQADVSRLAEEKADLFALHEDLVQCNAVMHAESTRLQEDRVLRGAQVEEWEREVVELRVQLSQALNSVECLRAVCKKMEDAFEGAKARVVELEGTICVWEEAGRDKTRHARRVEEYEREINGLCESIDVLKMRVEVLGQENAGLRSQLEELNATKWV